MQKQGGRQVGSNQLMQHFLLRLLNHEANTGRLRRYQGAFVPGSPSLVTPPAGTSHGFHHLSLNAALSHTGEPPPPLFCPYVFSRVILSNVKRTLISGLSTSPSLAGARPLAAHTLGYDRKPVLYSEILPVIIHSPHPPTPPKLAPKAAPVESSRFITLHTLSCFRRSFR